MLSAYLWDWSQLTQTADEARPGGTGNLYFQGYLQERQTRSYRQRVMSDLKNKVKAECVSIRALAERGVVLV
jgi:hypothetical protein